MKILIVGGRSSLAQVLIPYLATFAEVITAGRRGCDIPLDLSWEEGRIHLPQGLDVVVHLAANFGGKDFSGILAAEQVNVLGSLKLCHVAALAGIKHFVQISSIFSDLGEDSPFFSSYSLSKRHAEDVVRLYCSGINLPLTILRPAQIYGVGPMFRKHHPFLYAVIDKVEKNEDIVFYGSIDARRNLIHAEDVSEIIVRVVRLRILGTYSCLSPINLRYSEIAAAAINAFGSSSVVNFDPDKPNIFDNPFALDDSLYRQIGYFPRVSLDIGMSKEAVYRKRLQ